MSVEKTQSSSNPYVKVANFTGLYRHAKTGAYYAVKKIGGKRKERSLGTADRKIAERRFKEWVDSFGKVDSEMEKTTVRQLVARFEESNRGFAKNTRITTDAIIKSFKKWLGSDFDMEVRKIAVGLGTIIVAAALAILWINFRSDVHHRHTAKAKYPYLYSKTDLAGVADPNLFGNLKALFEGRTRDDVDEWLEQHKAPGDAQGVSGFSLVAYKSEGLLTMVLTFKNKYGEDVVETHNLSLNSKGTFELCR